MVFVVQRSFIKCCGKVELGPQNSGYKQFIDGRCLRFGWLSRMGWLTHSSTPLKVLKLGNDTLEVLILHLIAFLRSI